MNSLDFGSRNEANKKNVLHKAIFILILHVRLDVQQQTFGRLDKINGSDF